MRPDVETVFDEPTFTATHLVVDPATKAAAIIDPVLDFDPASGGVSHKSADAVIARAQSLDATVHWILETHVHADHLSAAQYLKAKLGGKIGIGAAVSAVQRTFGDIFNAGMDFDRDGSQFDALFDDGEEFRIGALLARVIHTPGHTPACVTYIIGDAAFPGDTLFMPDYGTARCDFPGGDASMLYRSIQKIFALPEETRLFLCHDYKAPGRDNYVWQTTVREERARNIHIGGGVTESDFVKMRTARDKTLSTPRLMFPSVQVNMRAGAFPPAESNGVSYLKLPLHVAPGG